MAFRLIRGAGVVVDPAVVNLSSSGTIHNGIAVDFIRGGGTGGAVVGPSGASSTTTMVFGVSVGPYSQGASDTFADVIPFCEGQLWEVDCANAASTAQLGLRHVLSASRGFIHNTATDLGAGNAHTAVFQALSMVGSTSGSGKLVGFFRRQQAPVPTTDTTFV